MSAFVIGCHLSVARGFARLAEDALSIGANAFQFFTRNPRGSRARPLDLDEVTRLNECCRQHAFGPKLAHAPYTLNPCSKEARVRDFARLTMADDLARLAFFEDAFYNFHPGSHTGQGLTAGIRQIQDLLNSLLTPDSKTTVLLETMSGRGSEIGSRFEELAAILEGVRYRERVGVCLDTCHVYVAGYDVRDDLDGVLAAFDRVIGLSHLKAIHLNDSRSPFHSHKDRHEKIGAGTLGQAAIVKFINHPKLRHLPFYLETPNDLAGYRQEMRWLRAQTAAVAGPLRPD